ncbi:AAA family ATPase [Lachnospiraceae bacterium C1.1]|nr:AAA family ATPase [Lachnospiraceae bacterium C1.1]
MNMNFYVLRLKICGIKNIEKPVEFNFYKKTIADDFNPDKFKIKAIYGENGSGKTAIITSVKMLQNLLLEKNYLSDNDTQRYLVEMINKRTQKGYIECEYYVKLDSLKFIMNYRVDFKLKEDGRLYITHELLQQKKGSYSKNKYNTVYATKDGSLVEYADKDSFDYYKEKTLNLLDKQTFATSLLEIDIDKKHLDKSDSQTITTLLILFALFMYVSIDEADNHQNYVFREKIKELDEEKIKVVGADIIQQISRKVLKGNDNDRTIPKKVFGRYKKRVERLFEFIKIFKPDLQKIEIEKKDFDKYYRCNLRMVYEDYTLDKEFESRGIKKLMDLFTYLDAASSGAVVFIDELDACINDVYLDKLIEYFVYYGKGQLCFTSHNLSPMSVLKSNTNSINFISSINTVHTWTNSGNSSPENAYKNGFIEDSPFNVDASDFLGIFGDADE